MRRTMTIEEYYGMSRPKRHKYGAQPTVVDDIRFDSKAEAEYYGELKLLEKAGQIINLELQPVFILQDKPKITYRADFRVTWKDGKQEVIDVKGVQTAAFRMKKKMFKARYPNLPLTLVKKKGRGWEVIS